MNSNQFQQGDVILEKLESIPTGAKKIQHSPILMTGETTHKHQLEDITNVTFYEKDGKFIFQVAKKPIKLVHEEHHAHTYEPGIYTWDQVREKDWLSGMTRKVID